MIAKAGSGPRNKGRRGELEFCRHIAQLLDLPDVPKPILSQSRDGGCDVMLEPFYFEVKRRETLAENQWWQQAFAATIGTELDPVVAYRQSRKRWRYLISARHIGLDYGFIQLYEPTFKSWALQILHNR